MADFFHKSRLNILADHKDYFAKTSPDGVINGVL